MAAKRAKPPVASEEPTRVRVKVGRPTALSPELAENLLKMAETGVAQSVAAAAVGISRTTLSNWLARGKAGEPGDEDYVEFVSAWKQATAKGEAGLVQCIRDASSRSWQAAQFLLERRFPKRWAKPKEAPQDEIAKMSDEEIERRLLDLETADAASRAAVERQPNTQPLAMRAGA